MSLSARSGAILTSSGTRFPRAAVPGAFRPRCRAPPRPRCRAPPGPRCRAPPRPRCRAPPGRGVERLPDRGQQRPQRRDRLKVPQPRRVRRADVDHHVVGHPGHQPCAGYVVRDRRVRGSGLGLADVHPDDDRVPPAPGAPGPPRLPPAQVRRRGRRARVVEAHPVHHGPVRRQPEHPRPGVARLRPRGHRTDLNEREAERTERVRAAGVLVEPGGQPQRPGQVQAERPHPEDRIARREPAPQQPGHPGQRARRADQPEPGRVRGLGRKPAQQHPIHQLIHRATGSRSRLRILLPTEPWWPAERPYPVTTQSRRSRFRTDGLRGRDRRPKMAASVGWPLPAAA